MLIESKLWKKGKIPLQSTGCSKLQWQKILSFSKAKNWGQIFLQNYSILQKVRRIQNICVNLSKFVIKFMHNYSIIRWKNTTSCKCKFNYIKILAPLSLFSRYKLNFNLFGVGSWWFFFFQSLQSSRPDDTMRIFHTKCLRKQKQKKIAKRLERPLDLLTLCTMYNKFFDP